MMERNPSWGQEGQRRSEIGPSRNVPPFSARAPRIALDPFHILKNLKQNLGLKADGRFTKNSLTNIFEIPEEMAKLFKLDRYKFDLLKIAKLPI